CSQSTPMDVEWLQPRAGLLLQVLEQHDVVGSGRSRDGQSLPVARPSKRSDRAAVGEVCELSRSATAEGLQPQIPIARIGDVATLRRPRDCAETCGADPLW